MRPNGYRTRVPAGERICPECGAPAEIEAESCEICGAPLDELLDESGATSVSYLRVEPRLFGVVPPMVTLAVAVAFLLLGIAVLALGSWIAGLVLLIFSAPLFALYVGAAQRDPSNAATRATAMARNRIRAWLRFASVSLSAWLGTKRQLLRLREELKAMRADRERVQFELGGAAYREETQEVSSLCARLREIEEAIAACEREVMEAVEGRRVRVAREWFLIQPTRELRH